MAADPNTEEMHRIGRRLSEIQVRETGIENVMAKAKQELLDLANERNALKETLATLVMESALNGKPAVVKPPLASELPPLAPGTRGQGDRLLALLRERPGAPQSWLAEKLYGAANSNTLGRLSSLLDYLRKTEKARPVGDGTWEALV